VTHVAEQEKSEHATGYQASGDQPLPRGGPGDVLRGQPGHLVQVAEHMGSFVAFRTHARTVGGERDGYVKDRGDRNGLPSRWQHQ
jgi:hypothetical protein